ncbi:MULTISPECIES: tRNA (adenosine(37)-N6)-threonylcarbamoyltransferase complex dimerization subunit type 1 TsaB [Microbacterium]|uniref:tRNA (adenosine(37)-N6)-threonylcarbamoyltransferase complex dimerization subunit type 1 TsaB n=1 Tax=Microbacterium TaxID=33882 RepID=UPI00217E85FC|nr:MULTISPECIES: tRNA (adenosine(37)-N6)-threonylcarbamoyltransferase complex dimerization subunit type 1 TsaB [Microbacterium]UWF77916.1 tRNA (adenosine(37)-N6)-threonylcarbamoyltransferase complex dimerization subunit type 1 TsaB [Microbacterium neungamense]WCM56093.1 tRNA (adenosine(37)-N6)-threonylcarbamoyltransferase complex dimerization subunit type 1 TsaB [Microbacterium sp. EF45047]
MILAVDTSLGTAAAVIDHDGRVVAEASSPDPLGHAEVIGDLLAEVVRDASLTHVVAGMGPGPFTGLRIGIAAARAVALGRGIPVVAVPSHFAPALAALDGGATRFAVVTDARRRELAVSVFDGTDADGIPRLTEPAHLVAQGTGLDLPVVEAAQLSAVDLARVGARAIAAGRILTDGEPLYLRSPDVVQPGAPKKVSA